MKKFLSWLLALAMMLSLCVGAAYADEADGELDLGFVPESLGDDPADPAYENTTPLEPDEPDDEPAEDTDLTEDTEEPELPLLFTMPMLASAPTPLDGGEEVSYPRPNDGTPTADSDHYTNQNSYSIEIFNQASNSYCWAIAALTCMQLSAMQSGLIPSATSPLLYDPAHLVYFSYEGYTDLLNPKADHITHTSTEQRGNVEASVMTLASWAGVYAGSKNGGFTNADATDDALHLKNGYWLSLKGSEDRAKLKSFILSEGGAALSYYSGDSANSYSETYHSYCYTGTHTGTDHEVVVVGWDDDYPALNFKTPPTNDEGEALNGAWLCRNSWGSGWGDGGYFWLSYYDSVLYSADGKGCAAVFDADSADNYDHLYQYEGCYTLLSAITVSGSKATISNVYPVSYADGDELLKAVGITLRTPASVDVQVYTELTDPKCPDSGRLVYEASDIAFELGGYHSIPIDPVLLSAGSRYAVVVSIDLSNGSTLLVSKNRALASENLIAYNLCSAGESFLKNADGTWTDYSALSSDPINFRIKAYTDDCSCEHSWSSSTTVTEATCLADGMDIEQCKSCGAYRAVITKGDHKPVTDPAVPATVKATGLTEGSHCETCETVLVEQQVVPKLDFFDDVESDSLYFDAIAWAVEQGITTGTTKTTFSPDKTCTRAQIVTFLWRANGCPEPTTDNNPFTDVKQGDYYKAILWAVEKGITTGVTDTTFLPSGACTRAQIVTFLWRACGSPEPTSGSNPFKDVPASEYYCKAVLWAVENDITKGTGNAKFSPNVKCTRAQAVTFLFREYGE